MEGGCLLETTFLILGVFGLLTSFAFWGWLGWLLFGRGPAARPPSATTSAPVPPPPAPVTVNVTVNAGPGGTTTTVVPPRPVGPTPSPAPRSGGPTPRPSGPTAPVAGGTAAAATPPTMFGWEDRCLALPGRDTVEFSIQAADRTAGTPRRIRLEVESQGRGTTEFRLSPCGTVVEGGNVRDHLKNCSHCRVTYGTC